MNKYLKGVLVLLFAFVFIPFVKADEINNLTANLDMAIAGDTMINEITVDSEVGYTATIRAWYYGGTLQIPQTTLESSAKYEAGKNYIVEVQFTPKAGNTILDNSVFHIVGLADGFCVGGGEGESKIVRFDVTLYLKVHFVAEGADPIDDVLVQDGWPVGLQMPENPTKAGSTFIGWYLDDEFQEEFENYTDIEENTTVYALFADNSKMISTVNVGVLGPEVGTTITVEEKIHPLWGIPMREQRPLPTGFKVDGADHYSLTSPNWVKGNCKNDSDLCYEFYEGAIASNTYYYAEFSVEPEEGYYFADDLTITVNDGEPDEVFGITDGRTYTHFIAKVQSRVVVRHTVTFNLSGVNGTPVEPVSIEHDRLLTPPEEPTAVGKRLVGWYKNPNLQDEELFDFEHETITDDITLYAKWFDDENAKMVLNTINIDSNKTSVYEGTLKPFTVTSLTDHINFEEYGSNTGWSKWGPSDSAWKSFGTETPTAVQDGTHYGLRILYSLDDGYVLAESGVKILFKNTDITDMGHTMITRNNDHNGYVYVDFVEVYDGEDPNDPSENDPVNPDPASKPVVFIEGSNNAITLRWDEQDVVTKYEIQRSLDGKKYSKLKEVTTTSYTDKGLTYGKTYYYKVRAYDGSAWTGYSEVVKKKVVPNAVTGFKATTVKKDSIKLEWKKANYDGYVVEKSTNNKKWSSVKTITNKSTLNVTSKGLKPGKNYYFRIASYKKVGSKKVLSSYSKVTMKTAPVSPKVKLSIKNNLINVKVTSVTGGSKYQIYRSNKKNSRYKKVGELTKAGTFIDTNSVKGKTYYYKVRACNSNGKCGDYSKIISKKVK